MIPAPSLLFVDDESEILDALRRVLRDEGYTLFTTTSPSEAMAILEEKSLDLFVTDIRMPEMSGLDLVAHARRCHPTVTRILLTGFATLESALSAINEGAVHRYLTKPWENDTLCAEIRAAVRERDDARRRANASISDAVAEAPPSPIAALSPRLRETAAALMTGKSEKQIAEVLGVSPHTTHQYVKTIYRQFKVSSRAEFMVSMGATVGQSGPPNLTSLTAERFPSKRSPGK